MSIEFGVQWFLLVITIKTAFLQFKCSEFLELPLTALLIVILAMQCRSLDSAPFTGKFHKRVVVEFLYF